VELELEEEEPEDSSAVEWASVVAFSRPPLVCRRLSRMLYAVANRSRRRNSYSVFFVTFYDPGPHYTTDPPPFDVHLRHCVWCI
jgi:hypothetical protein